jgi:WXG100 family type VII secretion target
MSGEHLRVEYEQLANLADSFAVESGDVEGLCSHIYQQAEALYNSGFRGQAADAFFREAEDLLLPVTQRLADLLMMTGEVIIQVCGIYMEADQEVAQLFRGRDMGEAMPGDGESGVEGATEEGGASWTDVGKQILMGDFYKGESTWSGTIGNVAVGAIPIVGQIADARDTVAAIKDVWDSPGSGGAWAGLGLAAVGWVPILGDGIKGSVKVGKHVLKEGVQEGLEQGAKKEVRQRIGNKMVDIHNAEFKRNRQVFLRQVANDPNQPKHVRGWVQQELNRLQQKRSPDWLKLTKDSPEEIMRKRALRAKYDKVRPSKYMDYQPRDIRMPPGYDVGHKNNQLPMNQVNDPGNFQMENSSMNRSKGASQKR